MENFKAHASQDDKQSDQHFVMTQSYMRLYEILKTLKEDKGRIIHILGAPGAGKSTNIYHAADELDLNVYNLKINISARDAGSGEVFRTMFKNLEEDLKLKSKAEVYNRLGDFNLVLIADAFHDSHNHDPEAVGFSQWTDEASFKAWIKVLPFYLLCLQEYFKHRKDFKKINLVFQTSWRVYIGGKKYDLFSDLGILSRTLVFFLQRIFTVTEISYSQNETIEIVKNHIPQADDKIILKYIKKYGYKPRFICDILEKGNL